MYATDDASFLGIGRFVREHPWGMAAHSHAFHELVVVMRGGQSAQIAGRTLTARAGDALFYRSGMPHEERSEPEDVLDTLFLGFQWPSCPMDVPLELADTDGRIRILAGWIHEERRHPSTLSPETGDLLLRALLLEYMRLWRHGEEDMVGDIRGFVLEHLAERIGLETLSGRAGMSKYHFLRTYKALSGLTPMEDVRRMRVERARDLILSTSLPLKEIAPAVGLGDVFHLGRLIRRQLGTTPAGLRRMRGRSVR